MSLQPVQSVYTTEKTNISNIYSIGLGEEIKYFQIPAYNNSGFTTSSLSHLWSFFNMRTETDYNNSNLPLANGGLLGSALEYLPEAFWTNGMVAFSLPNSNYRVQVYGQDIAVKIPLNSSYSGSTFGTGYTATTLYSSFTYNPNALLKDPFSLNSGVQVDEYISEASSEYTNNLGIGYKFMEGQNPNPSANYKFFDSGVVYLVSNLVNNSFTGATGSTFDWDYLYGQQNKYANGARLISFEPSNTQYIGVGGYDRIVGAMFLNYGLGFIFDPDLVSAFNWPIASGSPTTISGGTFTSGSTLFNGSDLDIAEILNVKIIADGDTWKASTNSSYIGTGKSIDDCGIATTTITLHNKVGECLAIVKPEQALVKNVGQYLVFDLELPLSQNIQTSLADTRGIVQNL